mgnify:CR=1 FL=1
MDIESLTLKQIKELQSLVGCTSSKQSGSHPMIGKRCLIRTYSAGVHIGDVTYINPENSMEVKLENSLRLWKWEGGGLSLSAVANNGIKGGRLNKTGEVYLTNAIEFIPTTKDAEKTYVKFLEDEK